ncbi:hypothetical protein [Clostridium ljungdahlii]|uniref:hypothetical protein n=1 Tax=Clostridium ljungdahlii TaxID=1538 RepID=UPI00386D5734
MDIGVYCIHPLVKLFGMPKSIWANSVILENGVDGAGTIMVNYGNMQGNFYTLKLPILNYQVKFKVRRDA